MFDSTIFQTPTQWLGEEGYCCDVLSPIDACGVCGGTGPTTCCDGSLHCDSSCPGIECQGCLLYQKGYNKVKHKSKDEINTILYKKLFE